MKKSFVLPFRQVHLDFHTSPLIPDIGVDFNPRDFARTMKRAHVNSVTVFAKCHHGMLYYNTKRPERHPGLKPNFDLLREQVDALHREGIRAPIYLSVQCDEYAADEHPEWIAREPDGRPVGAGPFDPKFAAGNTWQILDMASPYQDFLAEQTQEVLKLFKPVDGIFFDMCWDQPSTNNYFIDGMLKKNLNPELPSDCDKHAHDVSLAYLKRFHDMVVGASREATVYFNARKLWNLAEEYMYQEQVEIEALPTGGWGYMYFPKNVRFARNFGRQYLGMTARFHKSWADFGGLKPYPALEYETAQMIAHGAKCSIGDQLHPRGQLDQAAYDLIGKVYARVADREPWLTNAQPVAQVGLFQASMKVENARVSGTDEGATRMLTQLKHQFNVVDESSDLSPYELVVLPENAEMTPTVVRNLRAYLRTGGRLLVAGNSGLTPDGKSALLPELGIKPAGLSPFTFNYLRFSKELSTDVPNTDHVMYDPPIQVTPTGRAKSLAKLVEPYFERAWNHFSSHRQAPPAKVSRFSGAILNGRTAYTGYPIFSSFAKNGNVPAKLLVRNLINLLLPDPLIRITAPTSTEVTVARQAGQGGRNPRTIIHLLQYCPERRTPTLDLVEDIVPLFNVPLSIKLPKPPKKAYLAPSQTHLDVRYNNGRAELLIPQVNGHAMIVLES